VSIPDEAAPGFDRSYRVEMIASDPAANAEREWLADVSPGWLSDHGSARFELPDLSGVDGWIPELAQTSRGRIKWTVTHAGASAVDDVVGHSFRSSASGTLGEYCGDGVVNGDEDCDDGLNGAARDTPSCDLDCTAPVCGDGYTNPYVEQCDPPNGASCSASCALQ